MFLTTKRFANEFIVNLFLLNSLDTAAIISTSRLSCRDAKHLYSLATLFTTWPLERHRERRFVYENLIENWKELGPRIKMVVFTNDTEVKEFCRDKSVDVLPQVETIPGGKPLMKPMYLEVMKRYKSIFYSFVNSDILFSPNMDAILNLVVNSKVCSDNPIFMMGARTNILFDITAVNLNWNEIETMARTRGTLFADFFSLDYYITSMDYPWNDVADVAHGSVRMDNYMIWNANRLGHVTIDMTNALFCIHQSYKKTGDSAQSPNTDYNQKMLGRLYPGIMIGAGYTNCGNFIVGFVEDTKEMVLLQNSLKNQRCYKFWRSNSTDTVESNTKQLH